MACGSLSWTDRLHNKAASVHKRYIKDCQSDKKQLGATVLVGDDTWCISSKRNNTFIVIHIITAADLVDFLHVAVGRHTVCPTPSGDDHHRAHWRPAGRLPTQQEHHDNYQCQENHELWRWEIWTEDEISFSTPLPAQLQGVSFMVLDPYCSLFGCPSQPDGFKSCLLTLYIYISTSNTCWLRLCIDFICVTYVIECRLCIVL